MEYHLKCEASSWLASFTASIIGANDSAPCDQLSQNACHPASLYPPPNVVGRGVYWIHRVRPSASSSASVDGMVSGHFLGCFCTDLPEIQNYDVFWVKEETHEGDFQNFKIYHFGRIFLSKMGYIWVFYPHVTR